MKRFLLIISLSSLILNSISNAAIAPGRSIYIKGSSFTPQDYFQSANFNPVLENDRQVGIKITNIEPFSLWNVIGLDNNDIIFSVNGRALVQSSSLAELFEQLSSQPKVHLYIQRNGVLKQIEILKRD